MEFTRLGKTDLMVSRTSFGALPIQRVPAGGPAESLLQRAFELGINFFDTARMYTDSEEKLGRAFAPLKKRDKMIIATKSTARDGAKLMGELETSLKNLQTDYVDIYQSHFCVQVPRPDDGTGVYEAMLKAREQGKIRFLGITTHRVGIAIEAAKSGLFDTVQYPFSCLATDRDLELVPACVENDVGQIAMKAMSGGLIRNTAVAFAFIRRYKNVVPIWGIQRMEELEEWIRYENDPPALDEAALATEREALGGQFCRGCGYCKPCPAEIDIPNCARMELFLKRFAVHVYVTPQWQKEMAKIDDCRHCNACMGRCPYGLNTPELLAKNLKFYREFIKKNGY